MQRPWRSPGRRTWFANLLPQTTYNLRLVAERDGQRSEPGPEVTLDTATVDCGPKRGFCVIA